MESNKKPTELEFWTHINGQVIKACMQIKEHIGIKEDSYHTIFGGSFSDARGYYILGLIDDVLRVSMSLIENIEKLTDTTPINDEGDGLHRIVFEYINFQQKYWSRKLFESLIELIVFSHNNEQVYFRLYLLLDYLKDRISKQLDLEDFYKCKNNNLAFQIKENIDRINTIASENNVKSLAFSALNFPLDLNPSPHKIKISIRQLFKKALKLSDTREKILIGDSYDSFYGEVSKVMHIGQEGSKEHPPSDRRWVGLRLKAAEVIPSL